MIGRSHSSVARSLSLVLRLASVAICLAFLLFGGPPAHAAEDDLSNQAFWQAALADAPALDLEVVGTLEQDGVTIQRLRYTGSLWNGEPQRVYALYAHPAGTGPFPAVLQIHGGGQTCYPQNLAYFVKRGYACLSFDWTGPRDERSPDTVTNWSGPISGNHFGDDPFDPQNVLILHAALAGVRGIDVLCQRPEVDAARIGVQGVSWGGFLTWLVNGLNTRVKAAVPVYGIGEQAGQWNDMGRALHNRSEALRTQWRALFDPASFALRQNGAVLYADGANDFFGPQDLAEQRLAQLTVDHRRSYAPNRMHSLDEGVAAAGMAWLDAHLKPGAPDMPQEPRPVFQVDSSGALIASVVADTSQPVRSVHFDLSRGDQLPLLRNWLTIEASPAADGSWSAALPLVYPVRPISVVAQVVYASGAKLSSKVETFRPAQLGAARPAATVAPSDVIFDPQDRLGGVYIPTGVEFSHVDPPAGRLKLETLDGQAGLVWDPAEEAPGERIFATRRLVDEAVLPGGTAQLEIWTHGVERFFLRTNQLLREPGARTHEASVTAGAGWRRSVVSLSDFKLVGEDSSQPLDSQIPLTNWNEVHQLNLICEPVSGEAVALGRLVWLREPRISGLDR